MIKLSNKEHWLGNISTFSPDQPALISCNSTLSYTQFDSQVKQLASHLNEIGVEEKDHVGLLFSHNLNFWITVNAIWYLNAVPVPLNNRNLPDEIFEQAKQADTKILLVDSTLHSILNQQLMPPNYLAKIIQINPDELKIGNTNLQIPQFSIENPALILFTSGSSGKSKAVVHTFKSLYESVKAMDSRFILSSDDFWLASLPLYHIGGFMILVRSLFSGATALFPRTLKQEDIVEPLKEYAFTHLSFVSTTIKRMIESNITPGKKLKYVLLGGGPVSSELCIEAVNAGWPIIKVYGSTETCSLVTALMPDEIISKPGSSGKPIGKNILTVLDEEIVIQSDSLFLEYFNDSISTKSKLIDGAFFTGDIGWVDQDGYVFIKSRRDDIIITGGENVCIKEVEAAVHSITNVNDVFVFADNDETWGEIICAVIAGNRLCKEDIRRELRGKLSSYKIPKRFYFVDSIPRNEMGKVIRKDVMKIISSNGL